MRTTEIRRHADTKKGEQRGKGSHLSAAGVLQARRIGAEMNPFDLVLTSHIPRTLETAVAMGFAVDDQREVLGAISPSVTEEIGHQERWTWDNPFAVFTAIVAQNGPTARLGRDQQAAWIEAVEAVSPGGSVLLISHGRVIEAGLVTCFPDAAYATWGHPLHHGEGVRLSYHGGQFSDLRFLRSAA